ncbi:MAG TPA: hypothetical protein VFY91_04175 [Microbacterium sp.]|nr:hypothetical protein [Microbacterium sp.]
MKKTLSFTFAVTAVAAAMLFGGAGAASAAHCVDSSMTTPGFSYFGTTHVKLADHAEGGNPGPHAGTSGASNCLVTSGNPSERAPGRG